MPGTAHAASRRLAQIPGWDDRRTALVMKAPDQGAFPYGRHFSMARG